MRLSASIVCMHLCVEVCTPVCVCVCAVLVCEWFFTASHWVGISPFVLQLISVDAAKRAQPRNFIFGLPALRLNRCHSRLLCCSLCCGGTYSQNILAKMNLDKSIQTPEVSPKLHPHRTLRKKHTYRHTQSSKQTLYSCFHSTPQDC